MAGVQIKLYFNTGFDMNNIPANKSILENSTILSFGSPGTTAVTGSYFERNFSDLTSVKINADYNYIMAADYCSIEVSGLSGYAYNKAYYFVVGIKELASHVCEVQLKIDSLTTMGGPDKIVFSSGWVSRGHIKKTNDALFSNLASEDFIPREPLKTANYEEISVDANSNILSDAKIITSNIDLQKLGANSTSTQDVISGVVEGDTDASMYFPKIPVPSYQTTFRMTDPLTSVNHDFKMSVTCAFPRNNPAVAGDVILPSTDNALEKLYSCGQMQLSASYIVPKEYIGSVALAGASDVTGYYYTTIAGIKEQKNMTDLPFVYDSNIKNKKCFATYRKYVLVALASGDMVSKDAHDLYNESSNPKYPDVVIWSDPCSTGKPYARFRYIADNTFSYSDCVQGLQWNNDQIGMEGASGSLWNSLSTAFSNQSIQRSSNATSFNSNIAQQQNQISQNQNLSNGIAGATGATIGAIGSAATGNIAGVASSATNAAQTIINTGYNAQSLGLSSNQIDYNANVAQQQYQQQINENAVGLLKNNNVVAPTTSFTPEQNLGLYGYNNFAIYEIRKSDTDMASEDEYYQRFGYNGINVPLTNSFFSNREHYVYCQAFNVGIRGGYDDGSTSSLDDKVYGAKLRNDAISMLNKGVRVWREIPNTNAYETN